MSPRCGWTIRLADWLDVEDYDFENPDGSHFKIGCGSNTPSAILQLYSPGSQPSLRLQMVAVTDVAVRMMTSEVAA
jgi:hypothetical protein